MEYGKMKPPANEDDQESPCQVKIFRLRQDTDQSVSKLSLHCKEVKLQPKSQLISLKSGD